MHRRDSGETPPPKKRNKKKRNKVQANKEEKAYQLLYTGGCLLREKPSAQPRHLSLCFDTNIQRECLPYLPLFVSAGSRCSRSPLTVDVWHNGVSRQLARCTCKHRRRLCMCVRRLASPPILASGKKGDHIILERHLGCFTSSQPRRS